MIERIARAICAVDVDLGFPPWEYLTPLEIKAYMDRAKAAITAMNQWKQDQENE